ncbi:MAG: asparagine synthetase B, partial [Oscillospiraceae bacterium]|nr:asparagine synthetase B [Oscillospiraceae bacterium]
MCGIAGEIARSADTIEANLPVYAAMRDALARRGPDQDGMYFGAGAALVHTRLAVIDVENGRQPMEFWRGDGGCVTGARPEYGGFSEHFVLVYNGELYNTDELRRDLHARGHTFATRSDTEVLGRAYLEWGDDCLARLNGIFAFAVWEEHHRTLFLARDRIGVKPLFYA